MRVCVSMNSDGGGSNGLGWEIVRTVSAKQINYTIVMLEGLLVIFSINCASFTDTNYFYCTCYLNWRWYNLFHLILWDALECCPAHLVNRVCSELNLLQRWLLPSPKHKMQIFLLVVVTFANMLATSSHSRLWDIGLLSLARGYTCYCAILSSTILFETGCSLLLLAIALVPACGCVGAPIQQAFMVK